MEKEEKALKLLMESNLVFVIKKQGSARSPYLPHFTAQLWLHYSPKTAAWDSSYATHRLLVANMVTALLRGI